MIAVLDESLVNSKLVSLDRLRMTANEYSHQSKDTVAAHVEWVKKKRLIATAHEANVNVRIPRSEKFSSLIDDPGTETHTYKGEGWKNIVLSGCQTDITALIDFIS